uniref:Prefoldin subunit 2 n=1 Tax=Strombidinopsis acuminata TaxID=141414 RepID=A0A7S3T5R7_9SPIT
MVSEGTKEEELTPQQVQQAFQQLEKECTLYMNKIAELDQEVAEHSLVLKAFEKVEKTRRCFRMVGGVLVERTVEEVQPAIKSNQEKIRQAMLQLDGILKKKTEQRNAFSAKYGLNKPQNAPTAGGPSGDQAAKQGGGSVLV